MSRTILVCSALVACTLMSGAVLGAQPDVAASPALDRREPVKMKFQYEVRSLATRQGAEKIYRRLVRMVQRQCTYQGSRLTELRSVDRRCVNELTGNAVARIGSTHLAAVHQGAQLAAERLEVASRR